jgi:hypothetical protein
MSNYIDPHSDWQVPLVLRGTIESWLGRSGALSALPDAPIVEDRRRTLRLRRWTLWLRRRRPVAKRSTAPQCRDVIV